MPENEIRLCDESSLPLVQRKREENWGVCPGLMTFPILREPKGRSCGYQNCKGSLTKIILNERDFPFLYLCRSEGWTMALHMLGKSSAEELYPQPLPCLMRSSEVFISEYKNFKSHFMRKYKKLRLVEVLVW